MPARNDGEDHTFENEYISDSLVKIQLKQLFGWRRSIVIISAGYTVTAEIS